MASGVADGLSGGDGTAAPGAEAPEGAAGRQAGAGGAGTANADKTVAAVLGEIVWLMSQSAEFKQYLIADLEWLAMPPILLGQFRIFYHEGRPVAAVLYGRVSEEVERRLDAGAPTLRPQDWQSGEKLRVVKTVAPFGGGEGFAKETLGAVEGQDRKEQLERGAK
ncbi:MAG TPA: toxin-activating lysine-acyltransferase [Beijerinckiaceae bacterium]